MDKVLLIAALVAASCVPPDADVGHGSAALCPASAVVLAPSFSSEDCTGDVSAELNAWIATVPDGVPGAPTVARFTPGACYRIDTQLLVELRSDIYFDGQGATFHKVGTESGWDGSQWFIRSSDGITFTDMTVRGGNTAPWRTSGAYTDYEFQNNWSCWGCTNFTLDGVTGLDAWGDFLSTTPDHWQPSQPHPGNITVKNSTFKKSGRMGIAITAGSGFTITGNDFDEAAWSVIDIEVEASSWAVSDVVFSHNTIGHTFHHLVAAGGGSSLDVTNVEIVGNVMREMPASSASYLKVVGTGWVIKGNTLIVRNLGFIVDGAVDVLIDGNTMYARNYYSGPLQISDSDGIEIRNNTWLTHNGIGHWDDFGPFTNSTNITNCGNRREVDDSGQPYSPPDRVTFNDPTGC